MELFWKCFSWTFHCIGPKSTHLLGRCLRPTRFSRSIQICQIVWTCAHNSDRPTDVDLDSGPGSSWTIPKLWFSSDEASLYLFGCMFCCSTERENESSSSDFYLRPLGQTWLLDGDPWFQLKKNCPGAWCCMMLPPPLFTAALLQWCVYTKRRCWN